LASIAAGVLPFSRQRTASRRGLLPSLLTPSLLPPPMSLPARLELPAAAAAAAAVVVDREGPSACVLSCGPAAAAVWGTAAVPRGRLPFVGLTYTPTAAAPILMRGCGAVARHGVPGST
jgi:hypothetical protein